MVTSSLYEISTNWGGGSLRPLFSGFLETTRTVFPPHRIFASSRKVVSFAPPLDILISRVRMFFYVLFFVRCGNRLIKFHVILGDSLLDIFSPFLVRVDLTN